MIGEVEPGHKITETLNDLARSVTGRIDVRKSKRTLLEPLLSRLGRRKAS